VSRIFPELDGVVAPAPTQTATPLAPGRAPARNAMPVAPVSRSDGAPSAGSRGGHHASQQHASQQHGMTPSDQGRSLQSGERSCVVGGVASMKRFDTLLGLSANGGCHVVSVRAFREGYMELEVVGGAISRTTVTFTPLEMGERFVSTEHFAIGYLGRDPDEALVDLLHLAQKRLEKVSLLQLLKVILMDPGKRVEEGRAGASGAKKESDGQQGDDPVDMLKSLVQVYGSNEAWANFFADKEQQRNFCHNVSGSIVMIGHEDLECHYATPPTNDGSLSFFNYPKLNERYVPDAAERAVEQHSDDPSYLISDLGDLDIIKGGAKKLDRALDSILEHDKKPDMVVVRATCVPIVIGDDMEGSVERFKKKTGLPVIYLDNIADQHASPFRDVFRAVKSDPAFKSPDKISGSINLLGFPREAEVAPLIEFLSGLGITVNCRVLPEVDVKVMRRYTRAELAVLFDTSLYDSSYREIVGDIELPSIRPTAPYGVRHTRQWLWEVASALGRGSEEFEAAWAAKARTFEPEWERLRTQVAGYRLGFVLDDERIRCLREPRLWMGIPILDVLKEMGFGIDLLVRVPGGMGAPAMEQEAIRRLGDLAGEGVRIAAFSTPDELGRLLAASDANAFYSDIYFDRRLTRSGKAQFSTKVFQMGTEGAIQGLKQLLSVCRMPFYRKYASFLGPGAFHA